MTIRGGHTAQATVGAGLLAALLAGCGGSSGSAGRGATTPLPPPPLTSSSAAATTAPAPSSAPASSASAPASTGVPSSSAPAAPTTPAAAQVGLVLTGQGSILTAPGDPSSKQVDKADEPCSGGLLDSGFTNENCLQLSSKVGKAVGYLEVKGTEERLLVYTLRGATATLALRAVRTVTPSTDSSNKYPSDGANVLVSDLAGDGQQKLVFLVPQGSSSSGQSASVDLVEASGKVVLHRELKGGTARKAPVGGGLETFTPAAGGKVDDTVIRFTDGQWRLASATQISTADVPPPNVQGGSF